MQNNKKKAKKKQNEKAKFDMHMKNVVNQYRNTC